MFNIYADESGCFGRKFHKNSSLSYIVFLFLVDSVDADSLEDTIRANKRMVQHKGGPLQWKNLNHQEKNDDDAITSFLQQIFNNNTVLPISVISNKLELTSPGLTDKSKFLLLTYSYGLAFKLIYPFLDKAGEQADFYIDRNSDTAQRKLSSYIEGYIPFETSIRTGIRYNHYARKCCPKFRDKNNHGLQLADFIAGAERYITDEYLRGNNIVLPQTWQLLKRVHSNNLPGWMWRGLLYQPYASRDKHLSLLT